MATVPAPANLPLFYKDLVPLSSVDHADFRARPLDSAEFLVGQHAIPLTSDEFVSACRFFPIVFSAGDSPVPLALMGLNEGRTEEHTSELQSLMRISSAIFCLKKKK